MSAVLAGVLVYVGLQLLLGLAVSRRVKSQEDYFLAGRRLGPWLATFTIFATWFGAETCIGSAGSMYAEGLTAMSAEPFGYGACLLVMGLFFAWRLRSRRFVTLADLFRQRYSEGVERLAVLLMVPPSLLWAAAQIKAFGQVLAASSDLDVEIAIAVAAGVVLLYTTVGGMLADAVTDVLQGTVLVLGLCILLVAVVVALGGVGPAVAAVDPGRIRIAETALQDPLEVLERWAVPIFGSVVAQELVARVLASRSPQVARRSAMAAGCLYLAVGCIPVYVGLVAVGLVPDLEHADQVLPAVALQHLPTFFYILFAGALVSAILSTVDSALLVVSSLLSRNLIQPLKPDLGEKAKLRLSRAIVVAGGLLAYTLARRAEAVIDLVLEASAFGSAGLFVLMTMGLYSRIGGTASAFGALVCGALVWIAGEYVLDLQYPYLLSLAAAAGAYLLLAAVRAPGAPRP